MKKSTPSARTLTEESRKKKITRAYDLLRDCTICPWNCHVDRLNEEHGVCRALEPLRVSGYGPHFGEEPVLVGTGGSGTIFLSYCNLKCIFCQNYEISHLGEGEDRSPEEVAKIMLNLEKRGCENINLVSPTHFVPQLMRAIDLAVEIGLNLPIVYNSGGYDLADTLRLLEGFVDIYMPDLKYADPAIGKRLSGPADYPARARDAIQEMHRQVGDLEIEPDGIARRGLLVRHLLLPGGLSSTRDTLTWLAENVSPRTAVNIMDQYYPAHQACQEPLLKQRISKKEYEEALDFAIKVGLRVIG